MIGLVFIKIIIIIHNKFNSIKWVNKHIIINIINLIMQP